VEVWVDAAALLKAHAAFDKMLYTPRCVIMAKGRPAACGQQLRTAGTRRTTPLDRYLFASSE
jgi:hypothetical protein